MNYIKNSFNKIVYNFNFPIVRLWIDICLFRYNGDKPLHTTHCYWTFLRDPVFWPKSRRLLNVLGKDPSSDPFWDSFKTLCNPIGINHIKLSTWPMTSCGQILIEVSPERRRRRPSHPHGGKTLVKSGGNFQHTFLPFSTCRKRVRWITGSRVTGLSIR